MAAFSPAFSPTGFFAGPAADIPTELTRLIGEALGTFTEARVTRVVGEVISAPDLYRATLSRLAAEALVPAPPTYATLTRVAVEVMQEAGYIMPVPAAEVTRMVTEVLGTASDFVGKQAVLTRAVAEVIGSTSLAHRGLILPSAEVDAVTIGIAFDPDLSAPGHFALQTPSGDGYSLSWATAGASTLTETWKSGATVVTNTISAPSAKLVRVFTHAGTGSGLSFTDLGIVRPDGKPAAGILGELMVWDRVLNAAEQTRITDYLTCKWVTVACVPQVTAPFPACVT